MNSVGLWFDEGVSVYLSQLSAAKLTLDKDLLIDRLPPAHPLLLKGWTAAVGTSPYSVRWPSIAATLLTASLVFRWVARSGSAAAALLALVLVLAHPFLGLHTREARMYALGPLLTLVATYLASRLTSPQLPADGQPLPFRRLCWLAYVLCAAAAIYTHYYLALALAAHTLWVLARRAQHRQVRLLLSAQAVAGLLFLPWAYPVLAGRWQQAYQPATFERFAGGVWEYFQSWWLAVSIGAKAASPLAWMASLPLLAALALAAKSTLGSPSRRCGGAGLLLATAFAPWLLAAPVLWLADFFRPRLLIFTAPLLIAAACQGLASSDRRLAPPLGLTLLLPLLAVPVLGWGFTHERDSSAYYREVVRGGGLPAVANDLVISSYPWQVGYLQAYSPVALRHHLLPKDWWRRADLRARLERLTQGEPRVWVASFDPAQRFADSIEDRLPLRFVPAYTDQYGSARLRLYRAGDSVAPSIKTAGDEEAVFGGKVRLLAHQLEARGRGIRVVLYLTKEAGGGTLPDYALSLRLLRDGRRWIEEDERPLRASHPTSLWAEGEVVVHRQRLTLPAEAPPGEYSAGLAVYEPGKGGALAVRGEAATEDAQQYLLGTVDLK